MKNLFILGLTATALLTGCSNDEVLEALAPQEPQAIGFANPFLDKNTRSDSDLTTDNLAKFYVHGSYGTENTAVFTDEVTVEKDLQGGWNCSETAYWKNEQEYTFAAYSDGGNSVSGASFSNKELTIPYTNTGSSDLVYATATATGKVGGNAAVSFTFGHALAKVYFKFTSSLDSDLTASVTSISLTGANKVGTYAGGKWGSLTTTTSSFDFGSATAGSTSNTSSELYMIPQTATVTVSFTVTVSTTTGEKVGHKEFSTKISDASWTAGNVYSYSAAITSALMDGIDPIKFTVKEVAGWSPAEDGTITPSAGS